MTDLLIRQEDEKKYGDMLPIVRAPTDLNKVFLQSSSLSRIFCRNIEAAESGGVRSLVSFSNSTLLHKFCQRKAIDAIKHMMLTKKRDRIRADFVRSMDSRFRVRNAKLELLGMFFCSESGSIIWKVSKRHSDSFHNSLVTLGVSAADLGSCAEESSTSLLPTGILFTTPVPPGHDTYSSTDLWLPVAIAAFLLFFLVVLVVTCCLVKRTKTKAGL